MRKKVKYRNSRFERIKGYGGIEDPQEYINSKYGSGWAELHTASIAEIKSFTQAELRNDANNCALASITRIMKYYSDKGYNNIPSDINTIYENVREIGVNHGYDPKKAGIMRDLFVYTPWGMGNMVKDTWKGFGYFKGGGRNIYFRRLDTIKRNIDNFNPLLLNIAFGYYRNHTVSVIGYKIFSKKGKRNKIFIQIYDGWSRTKRYIDWVRFRKTPASLTVCIMPVGE